MSTDEQREALIEIDIVIQGRTVSVRERVFGRDRYPSDAFSGSCQSKNVHAEIGLLPSKAG